MSAPLAKVALARLAGVLRSEACFALAPKLLEQAAGLKYAQQR